MGDVERAGHRRQQDAANDRRVQHAHHGIIKRVIPDAISLSLARIDPKYLDACLKVIADAGKLDLFEWVIYHGYTKNPTTRMRTSKKMRLSASTPATVENVAGQKRLPVRKGDEVRPLRPRLVGTAQAKWNTRRMLGDLGHDSISSVFTICDFDHAGREINRKGLLKINDKRSLAKVKTAYYAVQNVVSVFDNNLVRQKDYSCTIQCEQPITWFAYRNEASGCDVLVFWNGTTFPLDDNDTLPATITVEGGKYSISRVGRPDQRPDLRNPREMQEARQREDGPGKNPHLR